MTDLTEQEEERMLAAEYALGLLSQDEAKAFEDLLAVDPELRAQYAVWAEDFASIADGVSDVTPPVAVQTRIEAQLFPATQKPSLLERFGLLPAALTGLVAAAAVLMVVNLNLGGPTAPAFTPGFTAQIAAEDRSLVVLASFDQSAGVLRVQREQGGPRDGRALELWIIAGDNPPVSLGVMPDAQTADFKVPADLYAAFDGGVLAISDEPPGGSPTGAPTGDVLAVGPVTVL